MGCLDENTVLALIDGRLDEAARRNVEAHLATCADCSNLVAVAAGADGPAPPGIESAELAARERSDGAGLGLTRGASVGRYVVLDLVGRGGMGEVYAAYDPQLDRKIALKLLHEGTSGEADASVGRERLLREAKAIARLSHPNVVVVHDAGAIVDSNQIERVFLAMEFVEGETLADWLAAEPRSWRETRDIFAAAGQGLAAAHDAGLVHRDFKPQNVMVGRDGSVRVMDFGLAGDSSGTDAEPFDLASLAEGAPSPRTVALTRTGTLLGTPLYMAPEQLRAGRADARTDQFSFCVALYEALYGERPFPSESFRVLFEAVVAGRLREPAQRSRAPAFLRRLVWRGLKTAPDERWPSMHALLAELRHDPFRRRSRIAIVTSGVAVVLAAVLGGQRMAGRSQRLCRAGADRLTGVWDLAQGGERREAVGRALLAASGPSGEETWSRVSRVLDDYARRWTAMHQDACEAHHVRGEQSAEVLDLRMSCLEGPLGALRALTGVLARADATIAVSAIDAAQALPRFDRCADVVALRASSPPPRDAATRAKVDGLRAGLADIKALTDTGKWDEGQRRVTPVIEAARRTGYKPVISEAAAAAAWLQYFAGDPHRAATLFEEAVWAALAARRDDLALASVAVLEGVSGYALGLLEEAERWDRLGRALLERLGPGHELGEAWLFQDRGVALQRAGDYRGALRELDAALALKRKVLPADHPDIALSMISISTTREDAGDIPGALEAAEQAVAIGTRAYGERSRSLAQALSNRGELLNLVGRNREAEQDLRAAIERWSWLGSSHPYLAYAQAALGKTLLDLRRPREAVTVLERALAIREKADPKPELLGETRFALARAHFDAGDSRDAALALADSARDAYRELPAQAKQLAEVDAWLAAHAGRTRGSVR